MIFFLDTLLVNNDDNNPNECEVTNDGTTSTTNGNTSLICCVCQDRASGRHYGVLSCEVINYQLIYSLTNRKFSLLL